MLIGAFLTHLETERGNSAATRNARLTAIRALFRYASLRAPEHAALIARVLAIPAKRTDTTIVCFFTQDETDALIAAAAATGSWHGHRDHALLALAAQTGLRVSELTGLRIGDIHLGSGPHVYCRGKGRRDRCTPLTPSAVGTLAAWLAEHGGQPGDPLFPTQAGNPLSRDAVARLLTKYVQLASASCPGLKGKTVSPHTLRHSAAMALEGRGVASDASFGSSREHALPATQRAALCALGLPGRRRGCGDLGLHGPPGSDATMMRLIQLRGPHHHCACWHRDASGNSQMHRVHHHLTQPAAAGRHRSCDGHAGPPHHWSRHASHLGTSSSRCTSCIPAPGDGCSRGCRPARQPRGTPPGRPAADVAATHRSRRPADAPGLDLRHGWADPHP